MIPFGYDSIPFSVGSLACRMSYGWPGSFRWSRNDALVAMAPNHMHSQHELHFILSGRCEMLVNGARVELRAGEYAMLGRNVPHSYVSVSEGGFERVALLFTFALAGDGAPGPDDDALADALNGICCHVGRDADGALAAMLATIDSELTRRALGYYVCVQALLTNLIVSICRTIAGARGAEPARADVVLDDYRLTIVDEYFVKRVAADASCAELARMVGVSVRQLDRILKQIYGCSFRDKLASAAISASLPLLANGDDNLETIAQHVGYGCASSFIVCFKRVMGVTPSLYRRAHKSRRE